MTEISKLPKEAKRGRIQWAVNYTRILSRYRIDAYSELCTKNRGSIRYYLLKERRAD